MGVRPQAAEHAFGEGTMIAAVMAAGDKGSASAPTNAL
jgi:hypothetical protein